MVEDNRGEYETPTEADSEHSVGRRRFLQLTSAAAAGVAGLASQTGGARAADAGFGTGGYGMGPYGGSETVSLTVEYVSYATPTTATLCAAMRDFAGAQYANCHFEWRAVGDDEWQRTWGETRVKPGVFGTRLTGLSPGTAYEFRAVAETSEDDRGTSQILQFSTPS